MGCGAVVGYSGVVRLSCFGVGGWHVNFLFTVEPLRLLPMVVAGFWRGFVVSFLVGVWWRALGVGVDAHNTIGCMMSVWCGIVFVWG